MCTGFRAGYVEITNTEIPASPMGDYPSGTYNAKKTKINNCCRNDGNYDKPIHLPKHQPFALIEQGFKGCQSIVGKAMIYRANYSFSPLALVLIMFLNFSHVSVLKSLSYNTFKWTKTLKLTVGNMIGVCYTTCTFNITVIDL